MGVVFYWFEHERNGQDDVFALLLDLLDGEDEKGGRSPRGGRHHHGNHHRIWYFFYIVVIFKCVNDGENCIFAGIFISPKGVLEDAHSVGLTITVWVSTGLLSMIGAVCYAEL